MLIKVTKNIYGNYRDHITGHEPVQLGCSEGVALAWVVVALKTFPEANLSLLSDITRKQVDDYNKSILA